MWIIIQQNLYRFFINFIKYLIAFFISLFYNKVGLKTALNLRGSMHGLDYFFMKEGAYYIVQDGSKSNPYF